MERKWTAGDQNLANMKVRTQNRTAKLLGVAGVLPVDLELRLRLRQGWTCLYCGADFDRVVPTLDHKTPMARGGTNHEHNIQLLCRPCNASKRQRTAEEHLARLVAAS